MLILDFDVLKPLACFFMVMVWQLLINHRILTFCHLWHVVSPAPHHLLIVFRHLIGDCDQEYIEDNAATDHDDHDEEAKVDDHADQKKVGT